MSIEVTGLTKIYGTQRAIDDVSFSAKPGEILGLLGPNGAGKTTTMKVLTCFMPATSGAAVVCGLEAGKDDLKIRSKIGYLPEHNPLYTNMYIKEYLNFVAGIHKIKNKKERISELIELVGLERERNKLISSLSKGYRQRVGLAQAMIHDPEVLILDEPISGLDPNQLIEIRNLISSLKKDKTIIFSSHILQEVESISDKIIILDKGKIVVDDSLRQLQKNSQQSTLIKLELLHNLSKEILLKLPEVESVDIVSSRVYEIRTTSNGDIRESIFDAVVDAGNKVLGMSMAKASLESVFKSATKEQKDRG